MGEVPLRQVDVVEYKLPRADMASNDFNDNNNILYGAYWPLFPLRAGIVGHSDLSKEESRHLLTQYTNVFAECHQFQYQVANQKRIHAGARSVARRIRTNALPEYMAKVAEGDAYIAELEWARDNPATKEAIATLREITKFTTLAGVEVPFSANERGGELTALYANARFFGAMSCFLSVAPDDVYQPRVLRLSYRAGRPDHFPTRDSGLLGVLRGEGGAGAGAAFVNGVQAQWDAEGPVAGRPGEVFEFEFSPAFCQRMASESPVACTLFFEQFIEAIFELLIGMPPTARRKASKPVAKRRRGLFGKCFNAKCVFEQNKRRCWHGHLSIVAAATPTLLSSVIGHGELESLVFAALDSMYVAEAPLDLHAVDAARRHLGVRAVKHQVFDCPRYESDAGVVSINGVELSAFNRAAVFSNLAAGFHCHCGTCHHGAHGVVGCRLAKPSGCNVRETRVFELRPWPSSRDAGGKFGPGDEVPWKCDCCWKEEERDARGMHMSVHKPVMGCDSGAVLSYELKRPVLTSESPGAPKLRELLGFGPDALKELLQDDDRCVQFVADTTVELAEWLSLKEAGHGVGDGSCDVGAKLRSLATAKECRGLLELWRGMTCRNGSLVEITRVLSGCSKSNTAPYMTGAGEQGKAAAMYSCKYMIKDKYELAASLSIFIDARKHIEKYPSVAEDTGSTIRTTIHFLERALNKSEAELHITQVGGAGDCGPTQHPLEAMDPASLAGSPCPTPCSRRPRAPRLTAVACRVPQAAAIDLGMPSSMDTHSHVNLYAWDAVRLVAVLRAGGSGLHEAERLEVDDVGSDGGPCALCDGGDALAEVDEEEVLAGLLPAAVDGRTGGGAGSRRGAAGEVDGDDPMARADDPTDHAEDLKKGRNGTATRYSLADGTPVVVSQAEHYAYRDRRLRMLTLDEVCAGYEICKLDKAERDAFVEEEDEQAAPKAHAGAGRPKRAVFNFVRPHKLRGLYALKQRVKILVPILCGDPPPRPPPAGTRTGVREAAGRAHAEYFAVVFTPWHAGELPDTLPDGWRGWADGLVEAASPPGGLRWSEESEAFEAARNVAGAEAVDVQVVLFARARLFRVRNVGGALAVNSTRAKVSGKWRMRSRTHWPKGEHEAAMEKQRRGKGGKSAAEQAMDTVAMERERVAACRVDFGRMDRAAKKETWLEFTTQGLAAFREASLACGCPDAARFPGVKGPVVLASMGGARELRAHLDALAKPRVREQLDEPMGVGVAGADGGQGGGDESVGVPVEFAETTLEELAGARAAWEAAGGLDSGVDPPLNFGQRAVGRDCVRLWRIAAEGRRREEPRAVTFRRIREQGMKPHRMVQGAGGTGKSVLFAAMGRVMVRERLGRMVCSAWTGVAASPFGAVQLCTLLGIDPFKKGVGRVMDEAAIVKLRANFKAITGVDPETELLCLVIDEDSFLDDEACFQIDRQSRRLTGHEECDYGGLLLVFGGASAVGHLLPYTHAHACPSPPWRWSWLMQPQACPVSQLWRPTRSLSAG